MVDVPTPINWYLLTSGIFVMRVCTMAHQQHVYVVVVKVFGLKLCKIRQMIYQWQRVLQKRAKIYEGTNLNLHESACISFCKNHTQSYLPKIYTGM